MRERHEIEREMFEARENLEMNLVVLESAVRAKIDLKARVRVAMARARQAIAGRTSVLTAAIAGAAIAGVLLAVWRTRGRWH